MAECQERERERMGISQLACALYQAIIISFTIKKEAVSYSENTSQTTHKHTHTCTHILHSTKFLCMIYMYKVYNTWLLWYKLQISKSWSFNRCLFVSHTRFSQKETNMYTRTLVLTAYLYGHWGCSGYQPRLDTFFNQLSSQCSSNGGHVRLQSINQLSWMRINNDV